MKQITKALAFAALAATALVSCKKELEEPVVTPAAEGIKVAILAEASDTKTELDGATTVIWSAGDKVGFINGEANVNVQSDEAVIDSDNRATFTGTVESAGTYYAYYPYFNDASYAPSAEGVTVRVSNEQRPSLTSFDPAADLLVSEAFEVGAEGSYSTDPTVVRFKRLGAFIKLTVVDGTTGAKLDGEYASSVAVQGENNLVGRVKVSGTEGLINSGSGYKKVTANYEADTFALTTAGQAAYFGVLPQTFAQNSKLIVTITTGKRTVEKTLTMPKDVELAAGQVLPIKVTIKDEDALTVKLEKVWEMLSTDTSAWTSALSAGGATCAAGSDFNITTDGQYVYVTEFGASKHIWAIDVNDNTNVKLVNTETVESKGFDGSIFLSCARVVKKNDGTPVLIASNLFQDGDNNATGRLYVWDNGIDNAPRVVTLQQWGAGRRLGDVFTTYGTYEDCWLIFGTQTGNGFVTFKLPTTGTSSSLISRLAIDLTDFAAYYPFPGELTRGMFSWRGGTHDDGTAYRNRLMTVASTEDAIKNSGAHTSTLEKLSTWMSNYENNNGNAFNYLEYMGKRYVIWCLNRSDNTKAFDLIVKRGDVSADWASIINTQGTVLRESFTAGMATTWKSGADCSVFQVGNEVYIALNRTQVGLVLYRMYAE